jgi:hypothetical protein
VITIGIDPHKSSHTVVAVDEAGHVGELRVSANKAILARLQSWAGNWPERTSAIEGAGALGHLLVQQLVAAGARPFLTCPSRSPHGPVCWVAATAARPMASTRTAWALVGQHPRPAADPPRGP